MKKRLLIIFMLFLFIMPPLIIQAKPQDSLLLQAPPDSLALKGGQEKSMGGYYVKAFFATIAIILFIVLGARWYRKISGRQQWAGRQTIRILNRKNVGPKQFILIVVLEDKKYAIGLTDQNISLLAELGPLTEEEHQQLDKAPQPANFAQIFNKLKASQS